MNVNLHIPKIAIAITFLLAHMSSSSAEEPKPSTIRDLFPDIAALQSMTLKELGWVEKTRDIVKPGMGRARTVRPGPTAPSARRPPDNQPRHCGGRPGFARGLGCHRVVGVYPVGTDRTVGLENAPGQTRARLFAPRGESSFYLRVVGYSPDGNSHGEDD